MGVIPRWSGFPELEANDFMQFESASIYLKKTDGTEVIEAILTIDKQTGNKYFEKVY